MNHLYLLAAGSGGNSAASFMFDLMSFVVPILVLLLIPKTLKASTAIMGAVKDVAGKAISGASDSRVGKAVKKSGQEGKLADVKGGAQTSFGKSGLGQTVLGGKRAARMEARGAANKSKAGEKLKNDIGALGLDRQLYLAENGKGDVQKAARAAVQAKQGELNNKRVLSAQDAVNLARIEKKNPSVAQQEINEGMIKMDAESREKEMLAGGQDRVIEDHLIATGAHTTIEATLRAQGMTGTQAQNEALNRVKQQAREQVRAQADSAARAAHTTVSVDSEYKVGDADKGRPVVNPRFRS